MYYWYTHVINIHTFIPCYVFKQYSAPPADCKTRQQSQVIWWALEYHDGVFREHQPIESRKIPVRRYLWIRHVNLGSCCSEWCWSEESAEAWSIWDHRRKRHANPNLDMTNYTGTRQDVVIRLTLRSIPRNTLIVNRDVRTLRYRVWVESLSQPDLPSTSMTLKPYSYI